jgi:hypothetical protein
MRAFLYQYKRHGLLAGVVAYFLVIALLRESPYWSFGVFLPAWAGWLCALLPLLPGIIRRDASWLSRGFVVSLFTPFQSGIGAAALIVAVLLAWWNRRALLRGLRLQPMWGNLPVWCVGYLLFVVLQWIAGAQRFTPESVVFSCYSVFFTPLCLLAIGAAMRRRDAAEALGAWLLNVILAQASVIVLYPFIVGRPDMLLAVVNGVLKPIYTVLNVPTPYPWFNPDWNFGSMTIVNYTGVVMTMGAVMVFIGMARSKSLRALPGFLLLIYTTFLAENALAIGAAGVAFVAAALAEIPRRWNARIRPSAMALLRLTLIIAAPLLLLSLTYAGGGKYADTHKAMLYRESARTALRQPARGLFGYGLGAYGSRASYTQLLPDTSLQRANVAVLHCIVDRPGMSPQDDFHRDFARVFAHDAAWSGTTQGLLVSGLIGIVMENGLIGVAILMCMLFLALWIQARNDTLHPRPRHAEPFAAHFGIAFLLSLSVVYNYTEIPTVIAVLLFPAALALSSRADTPTA